MMGILQRALDWAMDRASNPSWSITTDVAELLQFAAYIGEHEGFVSEEDAPSGSQAETEWRRWWHELPHLLGDLEADSRRSIRGSADAAIEESVLTDRLWPEPHEFPQFEDRPHLQQLFRRYWDEFQVRSNDIRFIDRADARNP